MVERRVGDDKNKIVHYHICIDKANRHILTFFRRNRWNKNIVSVLRLPHLVKERGIVGFLARRRLLAGGTELAHGFDASLHERALVQERDIGIYEPDAVARLAMDVFLRAKKRTNELRSLRLG